MESQLQNGSDNKRPIDPATGEVLKEWQKQDGFTPEELTEMNGVVKAVGLMLGPPSGGILAVDFDGPEAVAKFNEVFNQDPLALPSTVGVTSGKEQRGQRFFLVDQDWWPVLRGRRAWKGEDGSTCLELRWAGHQSVIAGAHPETKRYRWLPHSSPSDVDVAAAPDWLLEPLLHQEQDLEPVEITAQDSERAIKMLGHIDPLQRTSYDDWLAVGMALHKTDPGLPGFGLDKDLHLLVSDAAGGKTTAMCELATVMTARDKGFLDHEAPRVDPPDDPRKTALVVASDGEGSAYAMWDDYMSTINAIDRGAIVEIWAQDDDTNEQAWNVSLHNLERLDRRLAEGDVCVVIVDTANAIFRGAGINVGTGPIEPYLRLLKQIVCRHCSLWISHHTNRQGNPSMKGIGGHPAFQEVPSVVHLIEVKDNADGQRMRVWHCLKLRGSNYRRFSYVLEAGELKVTDGHYFQNCREQLLITIDKQITVCGGTTPGDLISITGRPAQSVYNALDELRSNRLIKPRGKGYRLTAAGQRLADSIRVASDRQPPWAA